MKTPVIFLFLIVVFCLIFNSCTKGGSGGHATIVAHLKHHGNPIPNQPTYPDTVWIKYNSTESPGFPPSNYDTYVIGKNTDDFVTLSGLKAGDYFIFGAGKDNSGPYRVTGGMAVTIKYSERKKTKDVDLAVTE